MFCRTDSHRATRLPAAGRSARDIGVAYGAAEDEKNVKTWVETKFYGLKIALFSGLSGY